MDNNFFDKVEESNNNADMSSQITNSLNHDNMKLINDMGQFQSKTNNNSFNDEELLKSFIGNNYKKIITRKFNFAGFFFTTFYMFYRKMFLYGILLFILNLIVLNIVKSFIVSLIFGIILGLLVNKVYLYYAHNKIVKIKIRNSQKNSDDIKRICAAKGGTSVGEVFLGFIIQMIIVIIIFIIMTIIGLVSVFSDLFLKIGINLENSNIENSVEETDKKFDGLLFYDTSVNILDEFSISIPSIFKDISDNTEYNYEYESNDGVFNSCSITLRALEGYSDADNLINQMADYYVDDTQAIVKTTNINNINWSWFSYNSSFGTTYYYGTTKDKKAYLLEYEIEEDAPNDCNNYRQQILNSINKK